ncbi:hypothetical protein ABH912_005497 [Pseudomonas sp. BT76 TE3572]
MVGLTAFSSAPMAAISQKNKEAFTFHRSFIALHCCG